MIPISRVTKTNKPPLVFNESVDSYTFLREHGHFLYPFLIDINPGKNLLDVTSENKKIFMSGGVGPFHIIFDNIFAILDIAKDYPDIEFVVDMHELLSRGNDDFVNLIKKRISDKANITFVNTANFDGILINNYVLFDNSSHTNEFDRDSIQQNSQLFMSDDTIATKRVYVSRGKCKTYSHIRISNESDMINFFANNGFEIVYPEDFNSIEEEVLFFNQVKTIVSISSSAIAWSVFMKPGGNVLELQTSFPNYPDAEMLHQQYQAISYVKDLNYYSISNYDKMSDSLIKKIEDSKILSVI